MVSKGNQRVGLFQLFKTFFAIGIFTLGGGVAMIPIMERDIVKEHGWLEAEEFLDVIAIAQSTPGVLAVNTSIYIGYELRGFLGALISLLGTVMPSFLIMIVIARFFTDIRENKLVDSMFMGIRPAVVALLASSVFTMGKRSKLRIWGLLQVLAVAFLVSYFDLSPVLIILIGGLGYLIYRLIKNRS